jgi:hypothetical protein
MRRLAISVGDAAVEPEGDGRVAEVVGAACERGRGLLGVKASRRASCQTSV